MISSKNDYFDLSKILIEKGCNLDLLNYNDESCLIIYLVNLNFKIAELLIKNKCNVNFFTKKKLSALFICYQNNFKKIARLIIDKKCDKNLMVLKKNQPLYYSHGYEYHNFINSIRKIKTKNLVELDFNEHKRFESDYPDFSKDFKILFENKLNKKKEVNSDYIVSELEMRDIMEYCKSGGNFNKFLILIKNQKIIDNNYKIMENAIIGGNIDIVKYLFQNNNYDKIINKPIPFIFNKINKKNTEVIKFLIDETIKMGHSINEEKNGRKVIFHTASNCYNLEILKYIIELGANINKEDRNIEILKYIISIDSNINYKNNVGSTPLYMACFNKKIDNITYLLSLGGDLYKKRDDGLSPFEILKNKGKEIIEKLNLK